MDRLFRAGMPRRFLLVAVPCVLVLLCSFPTIASAHGTSTNLVASSNGTLDGPGLFNLIMITLVEISAIFWVGAQCWLLFVPQVAQENKQTGSDDQKAMLTNIQDLYADVQQRFERLWAVPVLVVLALANIGVIMGQILSVTGQWASAFSISLLWQLATTGQYGVFWSLREICTLIALLLAVYTLLSGGRSHGGSTLLPSINLLLGAVLFIAMSVSSHASVVAANFHVYAILVDWFHLVASALWVGCVFYIVTCYLPLLQRKSPAERANAFITTLPSYARLAIAGMVILTVTGIFSSQVHLTSTGQLLSTAYGRTLIVKGVLVAVLLITSISHLFFLRPRLAKEHGKYVFAQEHVTFHPAEQLKLRAERLTQQAQRMTTILRWESLLGISILLCAGLLNVFGSTLSATPTTGSQQPPVQNRSTAYNATTQTTDNTYTVTLNVNPNRFGTNVFTVTVIDNSTRKATTSSPVSLFTTMLDMDMGTDNITLQPDGKGHYSGSGQFSMGGNWEVRVAIHGADGTLHEAIFKLFAPF